MRPELNIDTQLSLLFDRFENPRPRDHVRGSELHVGDYDATVQRCLLGLFAAEGAQALVDACHVVRVLESLGCRDFTMPDIAGAQVLVVDCRTPAGAEARVAVARPAWSLGRDTLARLLQPQLGLSAPRPRPRPAVYAPARRLDRFDGEMTLSGDCMQIPLTDLLQMLARNGRTGVIHLALEGGPLGVCCLTDGELTHAACHGYRGEEALVELMGVQGTTFRFTRERPAQRTIYRKAAAVLMDTVRLLDERNQ